MIDQAKSKLLSVPFRVESPELIPAKRYYDPVFFEREKEKLWPHVWQMACRLEEIPEVGDYVEYKIFEKSVIIVRAASGVKAFHNVCRHRGMRLIEGPGHCRGGGFSCPFHGWRYNTDGKNTFVFGRDVFNPAVLDPGDINLKPCRLETWGGCTFINFDDNAPPLLQALGPVVRGLDARRAEKLRTEWWCASLVPTNWKLSVEAFLEMYHLMRTHPELHQLTPTVFGLDQSINPQRKLTGRQAVNEVIDYLAELSSGMGGLIHQTEVAVLERLRNMPVPDDPYEAVGVLLRKAREDMMKDGLALGLPVHDFNQVAEDHPTQSNEFIFPNFFFLPMFGSMASYRIRPLTPETCWFEIWSLILVPEGAPYESPRQPRILPHDSPEYPLIPRQDYFNMPRQQIGLRSGEIEYQRLSTTQEGAISNFERLIDGYLAGLEPERLAKAAHLVNGGSFLPVRDLGF